MIWVLLGIGYAALCFVAYCIVCAGAIAERRAEQALRERRKQMELDATTARLWGDQHPWRITEAAPSASESRANFHNVTVLKP